MQDYPEQPRNSLNRTKLHRPRPVQGVLPRARLVDALSHSQRLTLLLAPAGYGKTTTLSTWLETCEVPCAWLSLDENDNELGLFVSYLAMAIRTLFQDSLEHTAKAINGLTEPSPEDVIRTVANDLDAIEQPFILALDDYHTIRNPDIQSLIFELVKYPPQAMRLVISSRHDPALPLARLRASMDMLELRADDLRFTDDEAALFLSNSALRSLDAASLASVISATEGWPVGLYLASLSMRHAGSSPQWTAAFPANAPAVTQYFLDEVLNRLPKWVQECLIKVSVLELLSQPLCEAVVDYSPATVDGQPILEWLEKNGMFVAAADAGGQWYRMHFLFRQLLLNRLNSMLTATEIAELHARASDWFEANGYLDDTLRHALQADGFQPALGVVARHRLNLMNRVERKRISRWTQLFPQEVIQNEPILLLTRVWVRFINQQFSEAAVLLDRVDDLLRQQPDGGDIQLLGEVAARRSQLDYWFGNFSSSVEMASYALHVLPIEQWYIRGTARVFLALSYQCLGDPVSAHGALIPTEPLLNSEKYQTLLSGASALVYAAEGDLASTARAAGDLASHKHLVSDSEITVWGRFYLGYANYQHNRWDEAEAYLLPLLDRPYDYHPAAVLNGAALLVRMRVVQYREREAQQIADAMQRFAISLHSVPLQAAAGAIHADLALHRGRLAEAGQWATLYAAFSHLPTPFPFWPPVVAVRILLEMNTPETWQRADTLVAEMLAYFTSIHNRLRCMELLALQACLEWNAGDSQAALDALAQSVALAEPGRYVRLFVDMGPRLKPLLHELVQRDGSSAYLAEVIAAFEPNTAPASETLETGAVHAAVSLTYREQDVLALLAKRLTDREIAESLVISTETVRSHINHLAQKLSVHGRRAIVQAAEDRGLLPQA